MRRFSHQLDSHVCSLSIGVDRQEREVVLGVDEVIFEGHICFSDFAMFFHGYGEDS